MAENEFLAALSDMLDEKLQPIKEDVQNLKENIQNLIEAVQRLEDRMGSLEQRVALRHVITVGKTFFALTK